jgi:hypothetical protein
VTRRRSCRRGQPNRAWRRWCCSIDEYVGGYGGLIVFIILTNSLLFYRNVATCYRWRAWPAFTNNAVTTAVTSTESPDDTEKEKKTEWFCHKRNLTQWIVRIIRRINLKKFRGKTIIRVIQRNMNARDSIQHKTVDCH